MDVQYVSLCILHSVSGLPKPKNVTSLTEMKETLTHLVDSLLNMSGKIDTMQGAIDFINKTFHEYNEPFYTLIDKMGGMKESLQNLHSNLHNINETLQDFKHFLRNLNSSVFNIEDTIKYIDDTVTNLGRTVSFLDQSVHSMNNSLNALDGTILDVDGSLENIDKTVSSVNGTAWSTNMTFESMNKTLHSLDDSIGEFDSTIEGIVGGLDGINISLTNIKGTVHNSFRKLVDLNRKIMTMNDTLENIFGTVVKLNKTYLRVNRTLNSMNETFVFINGTVLEVISELGRVSNTVTFIDGSLEQMGTKVTSLNESLIGSVHWMKNMADTLSNLNVRIEEENDTVTISMKHKDILDTMNILLGMNGTLMEMGERIDGVNEKMDEMEEQVFELDQSMDALEETLNRINVTFHILNSTMVNVNETLRNINGTLDDMDFTLGTINGTVTDLHSTFFNMNKTFDGIEATIADITASATEVDGNIVNAEETIANMNRSVEALNDTLNVLNESLSNLSGDLPDITDRIYNTNESLKMIIDKSNIWEQAHGLLTYTLDGLYDRVLNLLSKGFELEQTLNDTNDTFSYVNQSITVVNSSLHDMGEELSGMRNGFEEMQTSFKEIGDAFPNTAEMLGKINDTIRQATEKMHELSDNITMNLGLRNAAVDRHLMLQTSVGNVIILVKHLQEKLHGARNNTLTMIPLHRIFKNNTKNVEEILNRQNDKVLYLTATLPSLKNNYYVMDGPARQTHLSLDGLTENVNNLGDMWNDTVPNFNEIPKLTFPKEQFSNKIDKLMDKAKNAKVAFTGWTEVYKDAGGLLWDRGGQPYFAGETIESIKIKSLKVHETIADYQNAIQNASMTVFDVTADMAKLKDTIHELNNVSRRIKQIQEARGPIDEELEQLGKSILTKQTEMITIVSEFNRTASSLLDMRNKYRDINGTYNATEMYNNLSSAMDRIMLEISRTKLDVGNATKKYNSTINQYFPIRDEYNGSYIGIDAESVILLADMEDALSNTSIKLIELNGTVNIIKDSIDELKKALKESKLDSKIAERKLATKQTKFNFVSHKYPQIDLQFKDIANLVIQANSSVRERNESLSYLYDRIVTLKQRLQVLPKSNVSFQNEYELLDDINNKLMQFIKEIQKASKDSKQANETFYSLDDSERSLEEIKDAYEGYVTSLEDLEEVLLIIIQNTTGFDVTFQTTTTDLQDLSDSLDGYKQVNGDIEVLEELASKLDSDIIDTEGKHGVSMESLKALFEGVLSLRKTYSNFTVRGIDLDDPFIQETIEDVNKTLSDAQSLLTSIRENFTVTHRDLSDKKELLQKTLYNRSSLAAVPIVIKPILTDIKLNLHQLNALLLKVRTDVQIANISIEGVNDTLHTTDRRLFKARQKKLLADRKFPSLEEKQRIVNNTLQEAEQLVDNATEKVMYVASVYEDIRKRLQSVPTSNISVVDEGKTLHVLNETIRNITRTYQDLQDNFKDVNNTLWSHTGQRYSDNETLDEINERYKDAEETLTKLEMLLKDVDTALNEAFKNASNINTVLTNINDTLNDFESMKVKVGQLSSVWENLEVTTTELHSNITNIQHDFISINTSFEATKERYKHINGSVYDQFVKPLTELMKQTEGDMNSIDNQLKDNVELFEEAKAVLSTMNSTLNETFNTTGDLRTIVSDILNAIDIVEIVLNTSKILFNDARENSTLVSEDLMNLNGTLNEMKKIFARQEKKEFVETNFPLIKEKIESTNDSLIGTTEDTSVIIDTLRSVSRNIIDLQEKMDDIATVDVPFDEDREELLHMNRSLQAYEKLLSNFSTEMTKLYNSLFTDEGQLVDYNETMYVIKNRYANINSTLQDMSDRLNDVKYFIRNANESLVSLNDAISHVNESINSLQKSLVKLETLSRRKSGIEVVLNETNGKALDTRIRHAALNDTIMTLAQRFNHVSNPQIDKIRKAVSEGISYSSDIISNMFRIMRNMTNTFDGADEHLKSAEDILSKDHSGATVMNESVVTTNVIFDKVRDLLSEVQTSVLKVEELENQTGGVLDNLENQLEELTEMLIKQEKLDYIQSVVPNLLLSSKAANSSLMNVKDKEDDIANKLTDVEKGIRYLAEKLSNIPSINIPLANIEENVNYTKIQLSAVAISRTNLTDMFRNVDMDLLNLNGTKFSANDTLDDIKETFNELYDIFNSITNSSLGHIEKLEERSSSLKGNSIWIANVTNSVLSFHQLSKTATSLGMLTNETKTGAKTSSKRVQNISNIDSNNDGVISSMRNQFVHVRNSSLQEELLLLDSAYKNESKEFKDLKGKLEYLQIQQKNLDELYENMTQILFNNTDNIEGLLTILKVVRPLQKNISHLASAINETVSNFSDDANVIQQSQMSLQERLNDLNDDFIVAEKVEYLQDIIPGLNKTYSYLESVLSGIKRSIDDSNKINGDLQVTEREISKQSRNVIPVNISLADERNLLQTLDKRIHELIKTSSDIDRSFYDLDKTMLDSSGQQFDKNTSISTIKSFYSSFNETLHAIENHLQKEQQSLEDINNDHETIKGELNTTALLLQEANELLSRQEILENTVKNTSIKVNETATTSALISEQLQALSDTISNLSLQYGHVKNTTLHFLLDEANTTATRSHSEFFKLSGKFAPFVQDMMRIPSETKYLNNLLNTTSDDADEIGRRFDNIGEYQSNITQRLDSISEELSDFVNTSSPLQSSIEFLIKDIDKLKENFILQEKLEYIESVVPGITKKYHRVAGALNLALEGLNKTLDSIKDAFDKESRVSIQLQDLTPVNITTDDILNSIRDLESTNRQWKDNATKMKNVFDELATAMFNTDGSQFEPEISINDIKSTYLSFENKLNTLESFIMEADNASKGIELILNDTNTEMNDIQGLLKRFIELSGEMEDVNEIVGNLESAMIHMAGDMTNLTNDASLIDEKIRNVKERFEHVRNDTLLTKLDHFESEHIKSNKEVKDLMDTFSPLRNKTQESSQIFNNAIQFLELPVSNKTSLIAKLDGVGDLVTDVTNGVTEISKTINAIRNSSKPMRSSLDGHLIDLNDIYNEFLSAEKREYLQDTIPQIAKKYDHALKDIQKINSKLLRSEDTIQNIRNKEMEVSARLGNVSSILISLDDVRTAGKSLKEVIDQVKTGLNGTIQMFDDLNQDMLNTDGQLFPENETIVSIRRFYDDFNKTLSQITSFVLNGSNVVNDLNNNASVIEADLVSLQNLLDRFKDLSNDVEHLKGDINNTQYEVIKASEDTEKLTNASNSIDQMLNMLKGRFGHVKRDSLHSLLDKIIYNHSLSNKTLQSLISSFSPLTDDTKLSFDIFQSAEKQHGEPVSDKIGLITKMDKIEESLTNVENKLNNISNVLDDVNNSSKPLRSEFGERLDEIEQIHLDFLSVEKKEYLEETIPKLLKTYQHVSESIEEIEQNLKTTEDQIENVIEQEIRVSGKLDNMSSVLIKLDDVQKSNAELKGRLNRLSNSTSGTIQMFNELESKMLTTDGSQFPENETITRIQQYYDDFAETLNQINDFLLNGSHVIKDVNSSASKTENDLTSLETILDRFKRLAGNMEAIQGMANTTQSTMIKTNESLFEVTNDSKKTDDNITTLKNRFKHVKNDTLQSALDQFASNHSRTRESLQNVNEAFLPLVNDTERASNMFATALENLQTPVFNKEKLSSKLDFVDEDVANLTNDLMNISSGLWDVRNKSTPLSIILKERLYGLDNLRQEFLTAEKKEYLEETIPGLSQKYDRVFKGLKEIEKTLQTTEDQVQNVMKKEIRVSGKLENASSILIKLDDVRVKNTNLKERLNRLTNSINETLQQFNDLDASMLNTDGTQFPHNETITAIQQYYDDFAEKLKSISDILLNGSHVIKDTNVSAFKMEDELTSLEVVLDRFESLAGDMETLHGIVSKTESKVLKTNERLFEFADTSNEIDNIINNLKKRFKHVKNDTFQFLLDQFETNHSASDEMLHAIKSTFSPLVNGMEVSSKAFKNAVKQFENPVSETEELISTLDAIKETLINVKNNTTSITKKLNDIHNLSTPLAATFKGHLVGLQKLHHDLLLAEKREYIAETIPELSKIYNHVFAAIEETEKHIQDTEKAIQDLNDSEERVSAELDNETSIMISVDDIRSSNFKLKETLDEVIHGMNDTLRMFSALNRDMLNFTDGSQFSENETITSIKQYLNNFNDTLSQISSFLRNGSTVLSSVSSSMLSNEADLSTITDLLRRFKSISSTQRGLSSTVQAVSKNVNHTTRNITELVDGADGNVRKLLYLQKRFKHIKNSTLQDELNRTLKKERESKGVFDELSEQISPIFNLSKLTYSKFTSLNEAFNVPSYGVSDLEDKLEHVNITQGNVSDSLEMISSSLSDLSRQVASLYLGSEDRNQQVAELEETLTIQEKIEYLKDIIPGLHKSYKNIESVLENTEHNVEDVDSILTENVKALNQTRARIRGMPNINISLISAADGLDKQKSVLEETGEALGILTNLFSGFNDSLFNIENNSLINTPIENLNDVYNKLEADLSYIQDQIEQVNNNLSLVNIKMDKNEKHLKHISTSLDRYDILNQVGGDVSDKTGTISRTLATLQNNTAEMGDTERIIREKGLFLKRRFQHVRNDTLQSLLADTLDVSSNINKDVINLTNSMRLTSDKFAKLQTNVNEMETYSRQAVPTLKQLQEINDAVGDLQNVIEMDQNHTANMLSNGENQFHKINELLMDVSGNISALSEALYQQEKKEYLEDVLPHLNKAYAMIANLLNVSQNQLVSALNDVKTLDRADSNVSERISTLPSINISTSQTTDFVDSALTNLEQIGNQLRNITEKFTQLDETILGEKDRFNNATETIGALQAMYDSFNNTVQETGTIAASLSKTMTKLQSTAHIDLNHTLKISKELDRYNDIVKNVSRTDEEVQTLNTGYKEVNAALKKMAPDVNTLTDFLMEMKSKYSEVNSTDLHADLNKIQKTLVNISSILDKSENDLTAIEEDLQATALNQEKLNKSLHTISTNLLDLKERIDSAIPKTMEVDDNATRISNNLENVAIVTMPLKASIEGLNGSLLYLDNRFRQQQKEDYIKKHFPGVLRRYRQVNSTLGRLAGALDGTSSDLLSQVQLLQNVTTLIDLQPTVTISLEGVVNDTIRSDDMLKNITATHQIVSDAFQRMDEAISKRAIETYGNDESLTEIKERFESYNESMNSMISNLDNVDTALDDINNTVSSNNEILNYTNGALRRFIEVNGEVNSMKDLFSILRTSINSENNQTNDLLNYIENITSFKNYIQHQYKNVSDNTLQDKNQQLSNVLQTLSAEFQTSRDALNNLITSFNESNHVLEKAGAALLKPVKLAKILLNISNDTKETVAVSSTKAGAIRKSINNLNESLHNLEQDLRILNSKFVDIEDQFKQRQKMDYIEEVLPTIQQNYAATNAVHKDTMFVLDNTTNFEKDVRNGLERLDETIQSIPAIQISLVDDMKTVENIRDSLSKMKNLHLNTALNLQELDVSAFSRSDWRNETLSEIEDLFGSLNGSINNANRNIDRVNRTSFNSASGLRDIKTQIERTNAAVHRFRDTLNYTNTLGSELADLGADQSNTDEGLDIVEKRFESITDAFQEMLDSFSNVNSSALHKAVVKASNASALVKMRLQLVRNLFDDRQADRFVRTEDTHNTVMTSLNKTETSVRDLNSKLAVVDTLLLNITDEIKSMKQDKRHFEDEVLKLDKVMTKANETMLQILKMFKDQQKLDFITETFPDIFQRFLTIQDLLANSKSNLTDAAHKLYTTENTLTNLQVKMDNLPSVNIPLQKYKRLVNDSVNEISRLDNSLSAINITLEKQGVHLLNDSAQANDDSIKLKMLQIKYAKTNATLAILGDGLGNVTEGIFGIQGSNRFILSDLGFINQTITAFEDTRQDLLDMGSEIQSLGSDFSIVELKINEIDEKIAVLNSSMADINNTYSSYDYDTSNLEAIISTTHKTLTSLRQNLTKAREIFIKSNATYIQMDFVLSVPYSDVFTLNNTITDVGNRYGTTNNTLGDVRRRVNDILSKIPAMNTTLTVLSGDVMEMNDTLMKEREKHKYSADSLPGLEQKYRSATQKFAMTNSTLILMEDNIANLEEYISKMKERLAQFPTVNISLEEMEENITRMEDTLFIMKDHYKSVRGVVVKLEKEMNDTQIFGDNVSLTELKNQYATFNDTLEQIDSVLMKINSEFYGIDDQFVFINDTLRGMDSSLDHFEQKQKDLDAMNQDIVSVGETLQSTNQTVYGMTRVMRDLNETFHKIQSDYADIIDDSLEANNSVIETQINAISSALRKLRSATSDLFDQHGRSKSKFTNMNNTMFETVGTFQRLEETLTAVDDSYKMLSDTLGALQNALLNATNDAAKANNSLTEMTSSLEEMNATLFNEKVKHDFISEHFSGIQSKISELKQPLSDTESSINELNSTVSSVRRKLSDLDEKMIGFPTVNISLDPDSNTLRVVAEEIIQSGEKFAELSDRYIELKNNLTVLSNRTGDLGDIKEKYVSMNSSLGELEHELTDMETKLIGLNRTMIKLENGIISMNSSLDRYKHVSDSVESVGDNLKNIAHVINDTASKILHANKTTVEIEGDITDMRSLYRDLEPELLSAITDIETNIIRLRNQSETLNTKLQHLKSAQGSKADDLSEAISSLKNISNNQKELDSHVTYASNQSELIGENLQDHYMNVNNTLLDIGKVNTQLKNASDLIKNLNATLLEEKMKKQFIEENYPKALNAFKKLNNSILSAGSALLNSREQLSGTKENLNDLEVQIQAIHALSLSLIPQNTTLTEVQQNISSMNELYKKILNEYRGLNITELAVRQGPLSDVHENYERFENVTKSLQNLIANINVTLQLQNDKVNEVKEMAIYVNNTIKDFKQTEETVMSTIDESHVLQEAVNKTHSIVSDMYEGLSNFTNLFEAISKNFSHIQDEQLVKNRMRLEHELHNFTSTLESLLEEMSKVQKEMFNTADGVIVMNSSLHSTVDLIGELERKIEKVTKQNAKLDASLKRIGTGNDAVSNVSTDLLPELSLLTNSIQHLSTVYTEEQEKMDFIKDNAHIVKGKYDRLKTPLVNAGIENNKVMKGLQKIKDVINAVNIKLEMYPTLNVSTDQVKKDAKKLTSDLRELLGLYENISDSYADLRKEVQTLDDRNMTKDEMEQKYHALNNTLDKLERSLKAVSAGVAEIQRKIVTSNGILNGLNANINRFQNLRQEARKRNETIGDIRDKFELAGNLVKDLHAYSIHLNSSLNDMEITYKDLIDPLLRNSAPNTFREIKIEALKIVSLNLTLTDLFDDLTIKKEELDDIHKTLYKDTLAENRITENLLRVEKELGLMKQDLSKIGDSYDDLRKQIGSVNATITNVGNNMKTMNDTLYKEMQKQDFVTNQVPKLRAKYHSVNQTNEATQNSIRDMNDKISTLTDLITKIKAKMEIFGVVDTDNSVKQMDDTVAALTLSTNTASTELQKTETKLNDLRRELWKDTKDQFTKDETLTDVKNRIHRFNKTLDGLAVTVENVTVKITEMDKKATRVGQEMVQRDTILTTTPTPTGPPDWLIYSSSGGGQVQKDSASTTCSVGDLTEWEKMYIRKKYKDGKVKNLAMWVQGRGAVKTIRDRRIRVKKETNSTGGALNLLITSLECKDEGDYYCFIDSYRKWPVKTDLYVTTPPEDTLETEFPTEVFEEKLANFSCVGKPGYPSGELKWKIKHESDKAFRDYKFYSANSRKVNSNCVRTETNTVEFQFNMAWNNTKIRCEIANTDYYSEGIIRLLPSTICSNVRFRGTIGHPYTPHKFIVCDKQLNIMSCPGNTCYDNKENNCVQCKDEQSGDPCKGKPLYTHVPHENNCQKYYLCMGPTKTVKKCSRGYFAPNYPGYCVLSYAQSYCAKAALG